MSLRSPLLIFIHDWKGHGHDWDPLVTAITPMLAEHFQFTTPDLPGHGVARDDRLRHWSIPQLADALLADLLFQPGQKAVFIGRGLGGCVALEAAIKLGSQTQKLVTIDMPWSLASRLGMTSDLEPADVESVVTALTARSAPAVQAGARAPVHAAADAHPDALRLIAEQWMQWSPPMTLAQLRCPWLVMDDGQPLPELPACRAQVSRVGLADADLRSVTAVATALREFLSPSL